MQATTVGQLKTLIADVDDATLIMQEGSDHSLVPISLGFGTALQESRNRWTDDHGEAVTPGKRITVLLVNA